jgi:hypothetical protein
MMKNVYWSSCKVPVIRVIYERISNFNDRFLKNIQVSNFMKNHPVGAELFHANGETDRQTDRQTDVTKLIVAFRSLAYAPKKVLHA